MIKSMTRELRKKQTPAEEKLWEFVRNRRLLDYKFLRQQAIICNIDNVSKIFIADFFCSEKKLVIELDGGYHLIQKKQDDLRDYILQQKGLSVMRFSNEEVLFNIEKTIDKILAFLRIDGVKSPSLCLERAGVS